MIINLFWMTITNAEMQEIKNNVEVVSSNERQAMLTQIIDNNDSYYEQHTIYPLYEKKHVKLLLTCIKC